MEKPVKTVAVTGGAGQIAYSILFRIAAGEMLGKDQPIALKILEIPQAKEALDGVAMELEDCAFPLLHSVQVGTDPFEIFEGAEIALLIGASPRGPGMERKDLLSANAKIFIEQGKALNEKADKNALVLVVGNPCNTNALITLNHAPRLNPRRIVSMTRLDENRGRAQLAKRAKVPVREVKKMTIWGNHSSTQVADFTKAQVGTVSVVEKIGDQKWLETEFFATVQKRGAQVIAARGKSSAASAANAAIDAIRSLLEPTLEGEWFSMGLLSDGNPYGIQSHLIFSFPCRSKGEGQIEIVPEIEWTPFIREKIEATEKELLEEREAIQELL